VPVSTSTRIVESASSGRTVDELAEILALQPVAVLGTVEADGGACAADLK